MRWIERWQDLAKKVAIGGAVLLVLGLVLGGTRTQALRSYLFAYLFWLGFGLGSFAILMLHNLSGGKWGTPVRRILEAGARTLPALGVLLIPVLAGIGELYEWSHADVVAKDPVLQHKAPYLNVPFFLGRAVFFFAVWILWSRAILRLNARYEETGAEEDRRKRNQMSSAGLVVYVLTLTFAVTDWGMSLEAHWFSTIYGVHFVVGYALAAFAGSILLAARLWRDEPFAGTWTKNHFTDLGNMMLAFLMLWVYISFSQYLIIWSGNLPEETPWYLNRTGGGWQAVALALVVFHFLMPFFGLMRRKNKRQPGTLIALTVLMLTARVFDTFWLVAPAFHPQKLSVSWLDPVALAAIGGVWVLMFTRFLQAHPVTAEPEAPPHGQLEEAPAS